MKQFIPVGVTAILFVIVSGVVSMNISSASNSLQQQQEQLYDIQNQIEAKQQTVANEEKKLVIDTTGLDSDRVYQDDEIITDFAAKVCTWGDSKTYDKIRQSVMNDYGLTEDSDFMDVFLPPDVKFENDDGTTLSYIDTHERNCHFEEIDTYVTNINAGTYSYFAFVTFSSSDKNGAEATGTAIITYDVDANGKLANIHGYTISQ